LYVFGGGGGGGVASKCLGLYKVQAPRAKGVFREREIYRALLNICRH
jgi:hypothetical protein